MLLSKLYLMVDIGLECFGRQITKSTLWNRFELTVCQNHLVGAKMCIRACSKYLDVTMFGKVRWKAAEIFPFPYM